MTTSTESRPGGRAPHSTRQQLDELDALLQRVLELPAQSGEAAGRVAPAEPPPAEAPVADPIRPRQVVSGAPPTAEQPAPAPASPAAPARASEDWVPLRTTWQ